MIDAPSIQARRNQAAHSPQRLARQDYGRFCDAVRRLAVLTPTQRDVARFLAWATLRQGFRSLAFCSLSELTQVRPQSRPFAGLGKNDLSPALNALKHFGLVRVEERAALESGVQPVSVLLVIADVGQWSVPNDAWLFSVAEEEELLVHLLACRRRWTGQLPELAEEADLHDARAALGAGSAVADALGVPIGKDVAACRGASSDGCSGDALGCHAPNPARSAGRRRSECRNAESPANGRAVPNVGTSRASALSSGTKSSQSALTLSVEVLKDLLRHGGEEQFVRAMQAMIPTHENGDGGKWRAKWRRPHLRNLVVENFEACIEKMAIGTLKRPCALELHWGWQDFGGAVAEKK